MQEVEIKFRETPEWAKNIMRERNMRPRKVTVRVGVEARCGGNWHDANCKTLFFQRMGKVERIEVPSGETVINATGLEMVMYMKDGVILREGDMVLEVNTYPRLARLYVHPDSMPRLLS